jgi:DNA-binding CsgD family transcriptional regulator
MLATIEISLVLENERRVIGTLPLEFRALFAGDLPNLTQREKTVLRLIRMGQLDKDIASSLGIALRTAKFHVSSVLHKFNVPTKGQLIRMLGLLK